MQLKSTANLQFEPTPPAALMNGEGLEENYLTFIIKKREYHNFKMLKRRAVPRTAQTIKYCCLKQPKGWFFEN
ncbi:hypothetical protein DOY81_013847 [Sarcophaga bullata]|nr:hypothetical protein DOY81_013847 [Sarcophaga bullata]